MITINPCTILDLPKLFEIAATQYGEHDWLHSKIHNDLVDKSPLCHRWFLNNEHAILFEPISRRKCQMHTFGSTRDKSMKEFFLSAGLWVKRNTTIEVFLAFIERDRMDLRFFLKSIGAKKLCILPATDQILYAVTEGDIKWQLQ